jgi:hypothetical protein
MPSQLLKGVLLVVMVVDVDVVAVVVAMGMTVPILGARGVLKVFPLLPVLIHLWVIELRSEIERG